MEKVLPREIIEGAGKGRRADSTSVDPMRSVPLSGQSLGACFKHQLGVRRGRTGEGFVSGHFDLIPVQQWAEYKHSPRRTAGDGCEET